MMQWTSWRLTRGHTASAPRAQTWHKRASKALEDATPHRAPKRRAPIQHADSPCLRTVHVIASPLGGRQRW